MSRYAYIMFDLQRQRVNTENWSDWKTRSIISPYKRTWWMDEKPKTEWLPV